jgi:pimeloyl-ACP methyl ester carboxylesterase
VAYEKATDRVIGMLPQSGPTSRVYFSQRLRLHYVDWGNPGAPPLILLHGGRDHCRNWDWVAADLCKDYHVIAPDLRGHGDSAWSASGHYTMANFIYDFAQLIHQQNLAPVTIIAHSLGGNIALRYSGIYPETVRRVIAIEGLGPGPGQDGVSDDKPIAERMRSWIDAQRGLSGRQPRRYPTVESAYARMQEANQHLTPEQARHLTQYGVNQNEDGTYSWKFDHYVRLWPPYDMTREAIAELWGEIVCPTLLVYGKESWATNPAEDGRLAYFRNARVLGVEKAGHWVHHDQLDFFLREVRAFLTQP